MCEKGSDMIKVNFHFFNNVHYFRGFVKRYGIFEISEEEHKLIMDEVLTITYEYDFTY